MAVRLGNRRVLSPRATRLSGSRRRLRDRLGSFARARRRVQALRFAAVGVAIGGVLAALSASATLVFGPLLGVSLGLAVVLGLFCAPIVVGFILGWLRPVRVTRVAYEVDRALGLDERVTTALELTGGDRPEAREGESVLHDLLADEQIADALASLDRARAGAVYPARLPRSWLLAMGLGLLLAIVPWLIPWPTLFGGATPASAVSATNQTQAARLETLAQQLSSDQSLDPSTRAELATQLRQAAAQLRNDGADARQANQDLLRAEQTAAAAAPATGEDAALTLARVADALNTQTETQGVTQALDNQDIPGATAAMNQVASNLGQMTPNQRQAVASALQAASDAASGSDTNASADLQQAANAAKQGDANGTRQASQAIQQLGAASQAQRDAAQTQSELEASRQAVNQAAQTSSAANQATSASSQSAAQASASSLDGSSLDSAQSQSADGTASSDATSSGDNPTSNNQSSDQSSANGANGSSGSSGAASASSSGQSAASPGSASSPDSSGQNGGSGSGSPNGNGGDQNGQQSGSGYGTGSTEHLGNPNQISAQAQREVVVPQDPNAPLTSVSPSNQTQTGTPGEARVDYQTVLPQYRQQALQGMDSSAVPNDLRNVVKGYFDSLSSK